jgi:hypothetical protein
MDATFKKLNFKNQPELIVLNAPNSFRTNMEAMEEFTAIRENLPSKTPAAFILIFVTSQAEIDDLSTMLPKRLIADGILWIAYPKGTSKRYKCDFNRDTGWNSIGAQGFEPVRQVAIDEDWSALRFRRTEFIKTMTRQSKITFSEQGKKRIPKN